MNRVFFALSRAVFSLANVHSGLICMTTYYYPNQQRWYAEWKLSRSTYMLSTRFRTFRTNLHAQSVLINKISASELTRKFIKSALLVGSLSPPPPPMKDSPWGKKKRGKGGREGGKENFCREGRERERKLFLPPQGRSQVRQPLSTFRHANSTPVIGRRFLCIFFSGKLKVVLYPAILWERIVFSFYQNIQHTFFYLPVKCVSHFFFWVNGYIYLWEPGGKKSEEEDGGRRRRKKNFSWMSSAHFGVESQGCHV